MENKIVRNQIFFFFSFGRVKLLSWTWLKSNLKRGDRAIDKAWGSEGDRTNRKDQRSGYTDMEAAVKVVKVVGLSWL